MRLLFLSNEFPNACDPTKATFNFDLLNALAENHEVTAISPISWLDELRARLSGRVRRIPRTHQVAKLAVHHPRFYYSPGLFRQHYGSFLWWSLRGTVAKLRRGPRPDCVLSYWAHPDGEAAVRLARAWNVPSMVMVGGSDVLLLARDPRRRECIRHALAGADAVLTVSRDLAQKVAELGLPAGKIHVLRRGVDATIFSPGDQAAARTRLGLPATRQMLLWVGRMVPVKGLDVLLAACEQLRARQPDFLVCLVGDGPLRSELQAEAVRRGLTENIRFVGSVPHEQLADWFRAADLTVLPSRSEGIPNVLLESLACGTPFVASAVGGIPEISAHPAARLVPPEKPDLLAAAIADLLREKPAVRPTDRPNGLAEFAAQVAALAHRLQQEHPSPTNCDRVTQAGSEAVCG